MKEEGVWRAEFPPFIPAEAFLFRLLLLSQDAQYTPMQFLPPIFLPPHVICVGTCENPTQSILLLLLPGI